MSERETILLLGDIQAAINNIAAFTEDMTFEIYQSDLRTKHAVERNFEIIGEAVSRMPEEFKTLHPQIEWRILKDFRNFIIHEYFGINDEIVWNTIRFRIPGLSTSFSNLLK